MQRGVERLEPSRHVSQAVKDLLHFVEQQHAHALGQRLAQTFERVHRIPPDRRGEAFEHFEGRIRLTCTQRDRERDRRAFVKTGNRVGM